MVGRKDAAIAGALEAMAQLETRQRLEANGEEITWVVFHREFLRKYFLEDVRSKKEIEFLELRQGNKSVVEYAAKFGELAKLYLHYDGPTGESSKCIKFENELHPEIKKTISYQKIRVFADLVDSCQIYEEDNNAPYWVISDKRGKSQQGRGKPYDTPVGKGKQKAIEGKRTSGGDAHAGIVCFKCGKAGHNSNVATTDAKRCFCCGKFGHAAFECQHKEVVFFKCGEEGHIGSKCQKPKKEQASGKVFTLSRTQTTSEDALIRDTCFINSTPLITIMDIGVTIALSLVRFSTPEEEGVELLSARQLRLLMKEEVQALVASMSIENQAIIYELQVVREFPKVFPNEIPDVPPEREV
ncbi:uncharacterized protein LOC131629318 [Vicia villosa]|uniref:uncharacterized protein LOC131629318 n=1 Tax=Vicia villosa TaxID=3911 RepID=UPI00273B76D5|nr:uncharacterized protein LOC131629318 [Vicia villosa]